MPPAVGPSVGTILVMMGVLLAREEEGLDESMSEGIVIPGKVDSIQCWCWKGTKGVAVSSGEVAFETGAE